MPRPRRHTTPVEGRREGDRRAPLLSTVPCIEAGRRTHCVRPPARPPPGRHQAADHDGTTTGGQRLFSRGRDRVIDAANEPYTAIVMERSSPVRIAVVATDECIGRLLEDFLAVSGWGAVTLDPKVGVRELERIEGCSLVLCDLDLHPSKLEVVRRGGVPLIGFSSSLPLRDVHIPADVAAAFELPPNWAELRALIRSVL